MVLRRVLSSSLAVLGAKWHMHLHISMCPLIDDICLVFAYYASEMQQILSLCNGPYTHYQWLAGLQLMK